MDEVGEYWGTKRKIKEVWDWVEIILLENGKEKPKYSDKFLLLNFYFPNI